MTKKEDDLKPMTVGDLINLLSNLVKLKVIKKNEKISLASDEEGNSFSVLVSRGIKPEENDKGNVVTFYPLYPTQ